MAHHRARKADADLDDIWLYVATESGSMDVANRLIDSITDQFLLLPVTPTLVALATTNLASAHGVLSLASI